MFATETQNAGNENVFCVFRDSVAINLSQVKVSINYLELNCLPRKNRMQGMSVFFVSAATPWQLFATFSLY